MRPRGARRKREESQRFLEEPHDIWQAFTRLCTHLRRTQAPPGPRTHGHDHRAETGTASLPEGRESCNLEHGFLGQEQDQNKYKVLLNPDARGSTARGSLGFTRASPGWVQRGTPEHQGN